MKCGFTHLGLLLLVFLCLSAQTLGQLTTSEQLNDILSELEREDLDASQKLSLIREGLAVAQKSSDPKIKIDLYRKGSAFAIEAQNPELASQFLSQAHEAATRDEDFDLSHQIREDQAKVQVSDGHYKKALRYYREANAYYTNERDIEGMVRTTHSIAKLLSRKNAFEDSIRVAEEALSSSLAIDDWTLIARSYQNLGLIQASVSLGYSTDFESFAQQCIEQIRGNYLPVPEDEELARSGLANLELAIEYHRQSGSTIGVAECEQIKGDILRLLNDYESAAVYYDSAEILYKQGEPGELYLNLLVSVAVNYHLSKNPEGTALAFQDVEGSSLTGRSDSWITLLIAWKHFSEGSTQTAIDTLSTVTITGESHPLHYLHDFYRSLSQFYATNSDYQNAFFAQKQAEETALKIQYEDHRRTELDLSERIQFLERVNESDFENQNSRLENLLNSYRRLGINAIAALIIVSVMLSAILVMRIRKQRKSEAKLLKAEEKNEDLEDRLKRSLQYREVMFKGFSQELRTPMNGILGSLHLLKDTSLSVLQENFVHMIEVSSRSIMTLINDVGDLTKLEAGSFELKEESVEVVKLTETVIRLFLEDSRHTEINLIVESPAHPVPKVMADPARVQQILLILLGKAFQTTHSGIIIVRLERLPSEDDNQAKLQWKVEDSGVPQLDDLKAATHDLSPASINIHGVSIPASMFGASISKRLVRAMGGTIEHSESGLGGNLTRVRLSFPLEIKSGDSAFPKPFEKFIKKKAWIIDESEVSNHVIENYFRQWGIQSVSSNSFEKFPVSSVAEQSLDVICLSGRKNWELDARLQTIREIREKSHFKDTPIIIYGLYSDAPVREALQRIENLYTVEAPISPANLNRILSAALTGEKSFLQSYAVLTPEVEVENEPKDEAPSLLDFKPYVLPFNKEGKIDKSLKILLAEDNIVNQKVTSLMLKKIGFKIDIVSNGEEAVEAARQTNYDVILMDKLMPVMDGIGATLAIRKLELTEQPIIIALTASASMEDEMQCRNATMDNFLSKPVPLDKMKAALCFATTIIENRKTKGSTEKIT